MVRKIIEIDTEKCNGCGACAAACHESAIGMVNGTARLLRDDYCDGLGDCLPACPTGAIRFVEREAAAYDEAAVMANRATPKVGAQSQLRQWPVQIRLVPSTAPYFQNADLLIAADCTAYAYADFHRDFIRGRVTLVGCPKLDQLDYTEKLAQILESSPVQSVTVVRMEVPCCGGMVYALRRALEASSCTAPLRIVTIGTDGSVISEVAE